MNKKSKKKRDLIGKEQDEWRGIIKGNYLLSGEWKPWCYDNFYSFWNLSILILSNF